MSYNSNVSYGRALMNMVASVVPTFGRILVVFASGDAGEEAYMRAQEVFKSDTDGKVRFFTSLNDAYTAATSNNNDVIAMDADGVHTITPIAWTKSRIHVFGMDGGERLVQQGTRIQNATASTEAYLLKVTGTRNSFRNLKLIQKSTQGTALHVVEMGGEGTLYKNCSFIFEVADNLDQTDAYEVVCGEDSGTFINCTFGSDVLDTSVARAVMVFDVVTTSQEMKSCIFKDCLWNILSDDANANFIRVLATTDVKFGSTFINPVFHASINQTTGGVILTDAVDSVSGLVEGDLFFVNPSCNCTNFSSAITDQLFVTGQNPVAATAGVAVTPA